MSGDIRNRDAAAGAPQRLLSPIRDFDRVGRLAIATTAITGGVVAWAPGIPEPVRDQVLLAVLVCWTLTVFLATFSLLLAPDSERGAQSRAPWHLIGVIGIGVALVTATELWLVRRLCKLGGLTWNVDWRWAWGQAKTIARFGDLERSLAYAGEAVHYHAGPPWLAAAAQRVFGFGLEDVLFGLLPGLTVLSTVIALVLLLSGQGVSRHLATATVGVFVCLPLAPLWGLVPRLLGGPGFLFQAESWFFTSAMMLNSLFALSVGTCALVISLDLSFGRWNWLLGGMALGSMMLLKPQYLVGFGIVLGILGLLELVGRSQESPGRWRPSLGFVSVAGLVTVVTASLAAKVLPGHPAIFDVPKFAPSTDVYSIETAGIELLLVPALVLLVGYRMRRAEDPRGALSSSRESNSFMLAALASLLLLAGVFVLVRFQVKGEILDQAHRLGLQYGPRNMSLDLANSLVPVRLLAGVTFIAALWPRIEAQLPLRRVVIALSGFLLLTPLPLVIRNFRNPMSAYEAADDRGLRTLLLDLPRESTLLVSSDLADPAQDFQRGLRGFLLTAYGGHEFYLAELEYLNYMHADAQTRLEGVRAFFGAPWSQWHDAWLATVGVTHVLVHDRCLPVWWHSRESHLIPVASSSDWQLWKAASPATRRIPSKPLRVGDIDPLYGTGPCLGRQE